MVRRTVVSRKSAAIRPRKRAKPRRVANTSRPAPTVVELASQLSEALAQQAANSEVLRIIASSPQSVQPVFDAIVTNSVHICEATFSAVAQFDGELLHLVAVSKMSPEETAAYHTLFPRRPNRNFIMGRAFADGKPVHVEDIETDPDYDPHTLSVLKAAAPYRTYLGIPILRDGVPVGVIGCGRREVRPFTEAQIALVKAFADQAVIAIENTRLLNELRERTQEVVKLNQHLEQRVADQVGEIERIGRLRRFLPPQVADLIVASGSEKQLESHRREITALFCDLRGFTGFSESADPEDVMALLRDYHAAIGKIIIKYSGTLERYAGDGVMVVFNDPVPVENPALQAVLMALEMRDAIGALIENWRQWGHDIGFGIGIAHGYATLGTIGFEGRFDYAAIGTVSNVASRLCDEAKSGQILIAPRVVTALGDAATVQLIGEFVLKGIRRPLAAHNVLALRPN